MQGKVKWSKAKKYSKWDKDYYFTAHKCGYECSVTYKSFMNIFYYTIITPYHTAYNCLWDDKKYITETECKLACETMLLYMIDMANEEGEQNE